MDYLKEVFTIGNDSSTVMTNDKITIEMVSLNSSISTIHTWKIPFVPIVDLKVA